MWDGDRKYNQVQRSQHRAMDSRAPPTCTAAATLSSQGPSVALSCPAAPPLQALLANSWSSQIEMAGAEAARACGEDWGGLITKPFIRISGSRRHCSRGYGTAVREFRTHDIARLPHLQLGVSPVQGVPLAVVVQAAELRGGQQAPGGEGGQDTGARGQGGCLGLAHHGSRCSQQQGARGRTTTATHAARPEGLGEATVGMPGPHGGLSAGEQEQAARLVGTEACRLCQLVNKLVVAVGDQLRVCTAARWRTTSCRRCTQGPAHPRTACVGVG